MKSGPSKFWRLALLALLLLLVWRGLEQRHNHLQALAAQDRDLAQMQVIIFSPRPAQQAEALDLPATVVGWHDADVNARILGYVQSWTHDIGDRVRQGELLATLRVPELDAQVRQAQEDLRTARTREQLAEQTATRWHRLYASHTVSLQDLEDKDSLLAASRSQTQSSRERLHDLLAQQSYERIVAPFDGILSARYVDVGDLATSDPKQPLFHLVQTGHLRVFVELPQGWSERLHQGDLAQLSSTQQPRATLSARIIKMAGGLDPSSRSRQIELAVEAGTQDLRPGDYVEVHFQAAAPASLFIPITALIFRGHGLQVACLDTHDHVHLQSIVPGRDFGKTIEVLQGLTAASRVIDNPSDSIHEGEAARVLQVRHKIDDGVLP